MKYLIATWVDLLEWNFRNYWMWSSTTPTKWILPPRYSQIGKKREFLIFSNRIPQDIQYQYLSINTK
jgi:hypothetical protein